MEIKIKNPFTKRKTNWEKRCISSASFIAAKKRISKQTRKGYRYENSLFTKGMDLHLGSMGYVFDILYNDDKDLFYDAFLRLGVKIQHNAEAIRTLISLGLYGSGWTIMRTLIFDTHMLWYLHFNPHLIEEWKQENFNTSKDPSWRNKFSEKTIINNLKEKGKAHRLLLNYDTDFVFYSKAAHPSCFGIRFFQNENGELAYLPNFSMQCGHLLYLRVLGLLFYPTQILLLRNSLKIKKDDKLASIHNSYNRLMETLNALGRIAIKFHREVLGARAAEEITKT